MKQTRPIPSPVSRADRQQGLGVDAFSDALHHAMALAREGRPGAARTILLRVLDLVPANPDALQLLGMIARQAGRHDEAAAFFRRSLAVAPAQAHVHNNLGNSLVDLGDSGGAIQAYRAALRLAPVYDEARVNLAIALLAAGDAPDASATLAPLLHRDARNASAWAIEGQARRAIGELDRAITAFRTALTLRPDHGPTLHNLGVALRLAFRPDEALPLLRRAIDAEPTCPEIAYTLGNCLQDLGQIDAAIMAYQRALALCPTDRAVHRSLSGLLWRLGRTETWLASYRGALVGAPADEGLLCDLADRLLLAGDAAGAATLLVPHADGAGPELHYQLGRAHWSLGQAHAALARFDAAPDFAPAAREAARARIILDRPVEALAQLAPLLAENPFDQQALALQGLGWRLTANPNESWLNDAERFVSAIVLTPPDGDVADFNARLDTALTPLHRDQQHPLEQTLRGGTQSSDDLFALPDPLIAAVRGMIETRVRAWIAALPQDPAHPFLRRNTGRFTFSGSWSVRLRSAGFHENHIHPDGWISACYYVALPNAVARDHQGWLKFGETALRMGERERISRLIRPQQGLLVLFPSYFYHGTMPFDDAGHRTTIAFDIVPA